MGEDHDADVERLALAWQAGDRAAFRDLVLATGRELRIYVAAHCDSGELVEEVLQETYVACFERIAQYKPQGAFIAWLKRIARNRLVDHWRERRRLASLDGDEIETALADSGLTDLDDADERAAASARLHRCLDRLSPRARALIERRHLQSQPLADLAQQFKQSVNALGVVLHRIRRTLRDCMEKPA